MRRIPLAVFLRAFVRAIPIPLFMVANLYPASHSRSDLNARRCCGIAYRRHQSIELL
jgi:hypothetical protein